MGYRVTLPLSGESKREAEAQIDGALARVAIGSADAVVEDIEAASTADAEKRAEGAARKLLDLLCSMYDYCVRLEREMASSLSVATTQTARAESEDGGSTYMVAQGTCVGVTVHLTSCDAAGNLKSDSWRLGKIPYDHFPAMASFRSAMLTKNVFHRFRDFYLAVENTAGTGQLGLGKSGTQELLGKALSVVYNTNLTRLSNLASKAGVGCQTSSAIQEVKKHLWGKRLLLFHSAKNTEVVSDPKHEDDVKKALPLVESVARDTIRYAAQQQLKSGAAGSSTWKKR